MNTGSLLHRLRDRKIAQWGVAYLAGAWILLQVVTVVGGQFGWSEMLLRSITVLLGVGFFVALVLAWYHGERSHQRVTAPEVIMIAALLVIAGAAIVIVRGDESAGRSSSGWVPPIVGDAGIPDAESTVALAVLPLANVSGAADVEPFVVGIHDDILTQLSKISSLRVTSRTSVEEYRGTARSIPEIAGELGVEAVLEGGVQRSGDRIRVNLQLIDARSDAHLWAETYDRELSAQNVFAIQSEIAREVARALAARLTDAEVAELGRAPTLSLSALDAYHNGMALFRERGVDENSLDAVRALEQAVELDPAFGAAWAALSQARSWLVREGRVTDTTSARTALDRAVELAPEALETQLARGYFHYYARGDFLHALADFRLAERGWPGNADVLSSVGLVLRRMGRWSEAMEYHRRSLILDPRNVGTLKFFARDLIKLRRFDDAERLIDRAIAIAPEDDDGLARRFEIALWGRGDRVAARALWNAYGSRTGDVGRIFAMSDILLVDRDFAAAQVVFEGVSPGSEPLQEAGRLWQIGLARRLGGRPTTAHGDSLAAIAEERIRKTDALAPPPFGFAARSHLVLARAHLLRGENEAAVREARLVAEMYPVERDGIDGPEIELWATEVLALAGAAELALERIDALLSAPSTVTSALLRLHPVYDGLRDSDGFEAVVARAESLESDLALDR